MNRRSFLKTTAATAAGAGMVPSFSIGQPGPSANSKLNIAMIGAGHIASMAYGGCAGENIVALADVDENMFLQHAERFPEVKKAKKFKDFRVMLDKMGDQIDAVCINTPDHTHFVATMDAMQRGLHVCTQKPLTHNIWQAQTLQKAKHKYGVVTNMAVQGHTYDGIRQMREWYEAGVLGEVTEAHSWMSGPRWTSPDVEKPDRFWQKATVLPPVAQEVPSTVDWDLWVGPVATDVDYNSVYHPETWRGYYAFGNGMIGDWMPHIADAPVWILDLYDPVAVELEEVSGGSQVIATDGNRVRWDFERRGDKAPCTFYWHNGAPDKFRPAKPESWAWGDELPGSGTLFMGDKQIGYTDNRSNKPRLADREAMRELKDGGPEEVYPRVEGGPFAEWVRAIKGDGPEPGANFDYAAPFSVTQLLGALAVRHGGRIEWDAKTSTITNRPELNAFVKPEVRPGWEYGLDL